VGRRSTGASRSFDIWGIAGAVNVNAGHLNVSGEVTATNFTTTSDVRLKKDIELIRDPISKVASLRGVTFEWRADGPRKAAAGRRIGFIAQEVERVVPEAVATDERGYKSVAYADLVALLVEATKAQQAEIDALRVAQARDRAALQALEARLTRMEAAGRLAAR
jgi:hypothetical protein